MTEEQWNTLESIKDVLISWEKNRFFRSQSVQQQKPRIEYLCTTFGLQPINWACAGCVKNRLTALFNIYEHERTRRETK